MRKFGAKFVATLSIVSLALVGANQSCAIKRRHFVRLLVG